MVRSPLFWNVYEKVVAEGVTTAVADLVEAAFDGESAVEAAMGGGGATSRGDRPTDRPKPKPCYLARVEVTSFRGVGPKATLEVAPGPGLTLVTGRNGTGKSSFAEGLEVLLTGGARRLDGKTKDWKEGWRSLHAVGAPEVRATFAVEGQQPTTVTRRWAADAELGAGSVEGLTALAWTQAVQTHRPFLAYAELGTLLEAGPTKAHDALRAILGLEELTTATQRLTEARTSRERAMKEAKAALVPIVARLKESADPRAATCLQGLAKKWNLEALEPTLAGEKDDPVAPILRRLAELRPPTVDTEPLRLAVQALADLATGDSVRQLATAKLLSDALSWHADTGDGPCPVCAVGTLDAAWHDTAARQAAQLRLDASAAEEATQQLKRALVALRPPPPPADLHLHPIAAAALAAWTTFHAAPERAVALISHVEAHRTALLQAIEGLTTEARQQIAGLEDAWRPLRLDLLGWLPRAKAAKRGDDELDKIKAAETWLKGAEAALQADRFKPIAAQAQATWTALRQESSVGLREIALAGVGNKRHLDLELEVDGVPAPLGVMSQGEVNALALSLFIPRLVHADSPFHFVVIDDPVQSMDPFKVDGLAQVLHDAAQTRQVIVFTHDTRLTDAVRRMQIPATILGVSRRARSVVAVQPLLDPADQMLDDARAVTYSDEAGRDVLRRVIPALCRTAVEFALQTSIRRALLGRGVSTEEVELRIQQAGKTQGLAALAIFDDSGRGGDVYGWLNREIGSGAADLFKQLKEATHTGAADRSFVDRTQELVKGLRWKLK